MSPKKKIKPIIISNDDKEVKLIVDKSGLKDKLRNNLENGKVLVKSKPLEEVMSDSSDDNEEKIMKNFEFRSKSVVNDNYFMSQSVRSKTSKNAFSKVLENFDLNETQIKEIVDKQMNCERKQLRDSYINQYFDKWINLLNCGFNALLYGFGSKRELIDSFVSKCLQTEHHIVIHGYANEMSVKHMTSVLSQPLNDIINDEMKLIDRLIDIDFDLYLVIHSIDILCAKNSKIKSFLNEIVLKCKRLHMIASVDHINSGLIWSTNECQAYNWLWFNVPTFDSYIIEKAFSTGLSMISTSSQSWAQSLTLSSIQHVYDSLTINAQKIFILILNNFIIKDEANNGFSFSDCYTLCREEFLVNSETTLRAQISEFKDHKLLKLKKGLDGGEVIHVCIDRSVAKKFVDKLE